MTVKKVALLTICCVLNCQSSTFKTSDGDQIQFNDKLRSDQRVKRTWRDLPESQRKPHEAEATGSGPHALHSSNSGAHASAFLDPAWKSQWYAQDYREDDEGPVMDHELVPVYRMGITGHKITVGLIADGVIDQPDLKGHYNGRLRYLGALSYDPMGAMLEAVELGAPGTMAASVVAMVPNNNMCGVGVAYGANVTSIKMEKKMSSFDWESVLTHKLDKIDVYAVVAAGRDLGLDATAHDTTRVLDALARGATGLGRNMNGAVYVYPAGDDGTTGENCAADLLANARLTIVVAAANQRGRPAAYSERCAAVFAAAYSGDQPGDEGIVAQDSRGRCVTGYTGTGAAVAIASGIIALALHANPNLQTRDVMHLITMTSEVAPLANNPGTWKRNGAGFWVSQDFGFGLLNAHNMVRMAETWTNVNRVVLCQLKFQTAADGRLEPGSSQTFEVSTLGSACEYPGGKKMRMKQVEQVKLITDIRYNFRGAIRITLTSPSRTEVTMLEWRDGDVSSKGLRSWGLRALHFWGEPSKGVWTVNVTVGQARKSGVSAFISNFARGAKNILSFGLATDAYNVIRSLELHIYGTEDLTYLHDMMIPRKYAKFELSSK